MFCGFLPGGDNFVTVAKNAVRIWRTSDSKFLYSTEEAFEIADEGWRIGGLGIHPDGQLIFVTNKTNVFALDVETLKITNEYNGTNSEYKLDLRE